MKTLGMALALGAFGVFGLGFLVVSPPPTTSPLEQPETAPAFLTILESAPLTQVGDTSTLCVVAFFSQERTYKLGRIAQTLRVIPPRTIRATARADAGTRCKHLLRENGFADSLELVDVSWRAVPTRPPRPMTTG